MYQKDEENDKFTKNAKETSVNTTKSCRAVDSKTHLHSNTNIMLHLVTRFISNTKTRTMATQTRTMATQPRTMATQTRTMATQTRTMATQTRTMATQTRTMATQQTQGLFNSTHCSNTKLANIFLRRVTHYINYIISFKNMKKQSALISKYASR